MKYLICLFLLLFPVSYKLSAQSTAQKIPAEVSKGILIGVTEPLATFMPSSSWVDELVRDENGVIKGPLNIENRFHDKVRNPNALPKGIDPILQRADVIKQERTMTIGQNFTGQGNTGVNPADPSLCVGPSHIIQMINGSSGARLRIYDKTGATLLAAQYMDAISGISGLGDPIALYDQWANRYILTEFSSSGNRLIMLVSQTADPLGSWYIYQFTAAQFPDYPKFGIWQNAFVCTANESTNKVYAMDRSTMLAGNPTTTLVSFSIPNSPSLGFQAPSPVNITGPLLPASNVKPLILRMTDDAWGASTNDELQMWELDLNFTTPSSSTLNVLPSLATAPFSSDLCGFVTLNCIQQPGTNTRLDPIREVIMNRVYIRVFGTYISMVLCHAVDVTGTDVAGIRWYELRKTGLGPWSIYQQGTYSIDNNSRWMPTIGMDAFGNIGLAYNVSSSSVYPSLRFTGRQFSDTLGQMTEPEQIIVAGTNSNSSNRWGDYNDLGVDPIDDQTFWMTGMYRPSGGWSTQIASFAFAGIPLSLQLENFEAVKRNEKVFLDWTLHATATQGTVEVERSIDDDFRTFSTLARINVRLDKSQYGFTDDQLPTSNFAYYRLKLIDDLGGHRFSPIRRINLSNEQSVQVYPNPIQSDAFYIKRNNGLESMNLDLTIYSLVGNKVRTEKLPKGSMVHKIDADLPAGVYLIKVSRLNQPIYQQRIVLP